MAAVLLMLGPRVVPSSAVVFMLGVSIVISAVLQWLTSATTRRQRFVRLAIAIVGTGAFVLVADTCWVPDWLCLLI